MNEKKEEEDILTVCRQEMVRREEQGLKQKEKSLLKITPFFQSFWGNF